MKLEWMGDYRDVVEQLIKYCNSYAVSYKKEDRLGTDVPVSYAQMQVVEYLLENESLHQNMAVIASRLGITRSSFSKLVNKLVEKGLLRKYHEEGNRKNIIVQVSEQGRREYEAYAKFVHETHFAHMFAVADEIPRQVLPLIAEMLRASLEHYAASQQRPAPRLIPVDPPGEGDGAE